MASNIVTVGIIRKTGLFKRQVIIHKENSRAEDKVYNCGGVKVERLEDGRTMLSFTPKAGSVGVSSSGKFSSRAYIRPKSVIVDEVRCYE